MFTDNPFSGLAATVPPAAMQGFVTAMIFLVAGGTLFDLWHKGSALYFFATRRAAAKKRTRQISSGAAASIAMKTVLVDWLASGEFCTLRRRLAHLVTMYGFLAYAIATVLLVFLYPTPDTPAPAILPVLWHVGALMICIGGYWFWFFIRVDVVAEGNSPFRVMRADLFVLSLTASATLALIWSWLESAESSWSNLFLGLYLAATLVLFGSVAWSKFSHMFYKPAAAWQKRLEDAGGSRNNLPAPADKPAAFGAPPRHARNY
ncbi:MAG TPA: hypothetical protein VHY79_19925 [Rhizomicrobium sp.]|jgi:hypothetical protein|nr:hypothetical protein [Rhizomicrobium sp.]